MRATWLADVLRGAGVTVVELDGWQDRATLEFAAGTRLKVVWHHDASAPGDSPGVPGAMAGRIERGEPGAQLWVARSGMWHVVAAGLAYHTGAVLPGKPGNSASLGVETDHTVGEGWPPAQLDSLRRGTAAILTHTGWPAATLEFHRTICAPVGRKIDPDGLDLAAERVAVAAIMGQTGDDSMPSNDEIRRLVVEAIAETGVDEDVAEARRMLGVLTAGGSAPITVQLASLGGNAEAARVEASGANYWAGVAAEQATATWGAMPQVVAELGALRAAVAALTGTGGSGLDAATVQAAAERGAAEALSRITLVTKES